MHPQMSKLKIRSCIRRWYADVIRGCDMRIWYADVIRGCDVRMWYADVVRGCGTQMWYEDVICGCGTQMWYADVERGCDMRMWNADVIRRCGKRMWYADVVSGCDTRMWYADVIRGWDTWNRLNSQGNCIFTKWIWRAKINFGHNCWQFLTKNNFWDTSWLIWSIKCILYNVYVFYIVSLKYESR